jgi:Ca2+-binding RTX toxin-like protein
MATLTGTSGADTITPFLVSAVVTANPAGSNRSRNETLSGGTGGDFLEGGAGNDVLSDGGGNDTFSFRAFGGIDTAEWSNGIDLLRFEGFGADFDTAAEILATAVQAGADVRLTLDDSSGGTDTVVFLVNARVAQLDAGDFLVFA